MAAIQRNRQILVPRGDVVLLPNDTLVLGAESARDNSHIELKELVLLKQNPWNGQRIRDLDLSRQTMIVMVKRKGKVLIPNGDLVLREGDKLVLYSRVHFSHASTLTI